MKNLPAILVIAGPTASGKSSLAIAIAERHGAEIVSADSQAVYRGFDIGTAKPSAEELARVPHHLISVVDPLEPFNAARFQELADAAIAGIHARGKRAVVVGGTGLYLRVLLRGLSAAPAANPEVRRRLEEQPLEALYQRLSDVDPKTAASLPKTDKVRIVRALEIYEQTGRPASEHREAHGFSEQRYQHGFFVLSPPRAELYAGIDRRTRAMFEGGLVDEVKALLARGYREAAPMKSVGYAQALAVVDGTMTVEEAIAEAAQKTRNYAKRQLTWFKKEPGAQMVAPPYDEVARWAAAELGGP